MAHKSLHTLIQLSHHHLDEKQRALGMLLRLESSFTHALAQLDAEMQREREIAARESSGIGLFYGAYHRAYLERRATLEQKLATVRFLVERAREELAEAFRVLKTYEITQSNEDRRLRQEAERKETAVLDEIGLTLHRRKTAGERA